jgi:hypothetical protein
MDNFDICAKQLRRPPAALATIFAAGLEHGGGHGPMAPTP